MRSRTKSTLAAVLSALVALSSSVAPAFAGIGNGGGATGDGCFDAKTGVFVGASESQYKTTAETPDCHNPTVSTPRSGGTTTAPAATCSFGNWPFNQPRDWNEKTNYAALTGAIWLEGLGLGSTPEVGPVKGKSGSATSGYDTYLMEWYRRIEQAEHEASQVGGSRFAETTDMLNVNAFMWRNDDPNTDVPADILAAAAGITPGGKLDMRPSSTRIGDVANAILHSPPPTTSTQSIHMAENGLPYLGNYYATEIPVSQNFGNGTVSLGALVAMLDATTGVGSSADADWWAIHLAPTLSAGEPTWVLAPAYAQPTANGEGKLPIVGLSGTWTLEHWVSSGYWTTPPAPPVVDGASPAPAPSPYWTDTSHYVAQSGGGSVNLDRSFPGFTTQGVDYYENVHLTFRLEIPNRTRTFQNTVAGTATVQAALDAIIQEQMQTKPGDFFYLPVLMGPASPWQASSCPDDSVDLINIHITQRADAQSCAIGQVSYQADYDANVAFNSGGCSLLWARFVVPIPKIDLKDLQGAKYPTVYLDPSPAVPLVRMPVTLKLDPKSLNPRTGAFLRMGQNRDTLWRQLGDYKFEWNITQLAVSVVVGDSMPGPDGKSMAQKLGAILDAEGKPLPTGELIIPRDPVKADGGYGTIKLTFARTPLSVMQDPLCEPYVNDPAKLQSECGVTVANVGRGPEPAFALTVKTWWDGAYIIKGSDYRGMYNPLWASYDSGLCSQIVPWNDAWSKLGLVSGPWGRGVGSYMGTNDQSTADAKDLFPPYNNVHTWPMSRAGFSSTLPIGGQKSANDALDYSSCPARGDLNRIDGAPVYQPSTVTYIPVLQVQAAGSGR